MAEPTRVAARLASLRGQGVRVSIDDFGTGYTSLALLTQLPVDELKLDSTFTSRLHTPAGAAVVESVALLGRGLGLTLVGEGVEDHPTADLLRRHGFHLLQGYHFGRPRPAQGLEERWTRTDTPTPHRPVSGPRAATAAGRRSSRHTCGESGRG
jgi:diguanylate cyclase